MEWGSGWAHVARRMRNDTHEVTTNPVDDCDRDDWCRAPAASDRDPVFPDLREPARDVGLERTLFDQYSLLQMTLGHEIQISYPTLSQSHCNKLGDLVVIVMQKGRPLIFRNRNSDP